MASPAAPPARSRREAWLRLLGASALGGALGLPLGLQVCLQVATASGQAQDIVNVLLGGVAGGAAAGLVIGGLQQLLAAEELGRVGGWVWPSVRRWVLTGTTSALVLAVLLLSGDMLTALAALAIGALMVRLLERRAWSGVAGAGLRWGLCTVLAGLAGVVALHVVY